MEMTRTKFWAAPKFVRRPRDSGRRRPIRRDGRGRRRFSGRRGEGDGRRPGRRADGVPRRPGRRGDGRGGPRRPGSRAAGGTRRPGDSSLLRFVAGYARSPLGKFVIGGGSNMSDFTYVENVAHANICAEQALCSNAASVAGKPFFVTNDEPMETWEFMNCIMEAMGCQRPRINLPAKMLLSAALFSNMIRHRLRFQMFSTPLLHPNTIYFLSCTRTFNTSKARRLLGYYPIVSLEVFAFLYSIKLLLNFQFRFLMGLVLASLFIVFIVYEQCEEEIDSLVSNASFKIKWLMDRVVERMPASLKAYIS